jgi:hypothetical protein
VSYLITFFSHSKAVREAAASLGIEATVRLSDYSLAVAGDAAAPRWRAKFMGSMDGRLMYTDRPAPGTVGFAGWVPYPMRRWPIALDKSAFKRHAIARGVPTPPACFDPARIHGPFVVKKTSSSFGEGLRGPFLQFDGDNPAQLLADGEYYENFIVGHIAKAWCFADQCVAVHLHPPSIVCGDGQRALRDLVLALPNNRGAENDWEVILHLAQYCGVQALDTVLVTGKEVLVEYRYGSRYELPSMENKNVMHELRDTALGRQFARAAEVCAGEITGGEEAPALFTLDAIVDQQGTAWFLEMNCNPLVHPDAYGPMLARYGVTPQAYRAPSPA